MDHVADLFAGIPDDGAGERFETLLETPGFRVERIVSRGHASTEGFWYDQGTHEWVLLLKGAARVTLEGGGSFELLPGAALNIPAHTRHRVDWTDPTQPTVWLAIHYPSGSVPDGPAASS